ncbi:peptidylprolyl isomerase, partial [Arthrospira platensis SPKY1]|nr:peptidylprolyl isomerase [Arthrospira platensis SPKY1]
SETACDAIDALISREVNAPEPSDVDCQRFYQANPGRFRKGERAELRHVLFAVTPGVDVAALRSRAERTLLDVRCHDGKSNSGFAEAARTLSNCPSATQGGSLGWVTRQNCVEEFAREVFGSDEVGVLPRLVATRFGLHVVEVLGRDPGEVPDFEQVAGAVRATLQRQ